MEQNSEQVWQTYYKKKKAQRLAEAEGLWTLMEIAGITKKTILALDFVHFGNDKKSVEELCTQLSENYYVEIIEVDNEYWYVKGTTRPQGINLSKEEHSAWVEFMADVAQSYACVFSSWSLESPKLNVVFNSEDIEIDS